jgi:hypothetical protein
MTGWTRLHKIAIWDASDCKRGGGNGGFRLKVVRVYKQSVLHSLGSLETKHRKTTGPSNLLTFAMRKSV